MVMKPHSYFTNLIKPLGQNTPLVLFAKGMAKRHHPESLCTESVCHGFIYNSISLTKHQATNSFFTL